MRETPYAVDSVQRSLRLWYVGIVSAVGGMPGGYRVRQPSILDVLRAVSEVGASHPEIQTWWYAPVRRMRLRGELARGSGAELEVVVEVDAAAADLGRIGRELAESLGGGGTVSVRKHRGQAEERQLYRLLTRQKPRTAS